MRQLNDFVTATKRSAPSTKRLVVTAKFLVTAPIFDLFALNFVAATIFFRVSLYGISDLIRFTPKCRLGPRIITLKETAFKRRHLKRNTGVEKDTMK